MEEGGWNSGEVRWNEKKKLSAEEEDEGIGGLQRMENEKSDGLQKRKMKMIGFYRGWKIKMEVTGTVSCGVEEAEFLL